MTTYAAPRTVAEAVALLAATPGAALVAGGTDLVVGVRSGKQEWPGALVAIHGVEELHGIEGTVRDWWTVSAKAPCETDRSAQLERVSTEASSEAELETGQVVRRDLVRTRRKDLACEPISGEER